MQIQCSVYAAHFLVIAHRAWRDALQHPELAAMHRRALLNNALMNMNFGLATLRWDARRREREG